ncbi:MAG: ribulose-phosphate 3-epimerase [Sphaerochaetaceae bacterium]
MEPKSNCIFAPSVLSADFTNLAAAILAIEESTAQWVHLDVMDGSFVPNITFGAMAIKQMRPLTRLPFDAHLMVVNPERHIKEFAQAGCDLITVHSEATVHLNRTINMIHDQGKHAGVSIVPSTPITAIDYVLEEVELVLIMSVNPGYGGQTFIPNSLRKIRELVQLRQEYDLSFRISVDGGVNLQNAETIVNAGADVLIMGSAFFAAEDKKALATFIQGLPT